MNIVEALKTHQVSLSCLNRWLRWEDDEGDEGLWVVLQRPHGARKTICLIATTDEGKAVAALMGDEQ